MFRKKANGRRIAATLLAIALSACGSIRVPVRRAPESRRPRSRASFTSRSSTERHAGGRWSAGGEYPPAPASIAGR